MAKTSKNPNGPYAYQGMIGNPFGRLALMIFGVIQPTRKSGGVLGTHRPMSFAAVFLFGFIVMALTIIFLPDSWFRF